MAWIETIDRDRADGELLAALTAMAARPMPPVYRPPHGGTPMIVRSHSLEPSLMKVAFAVSGTLHAPGGLAWAERELIASVASRTNQCLY